MPLEWKQIEDTAGSQSRATVAQSVGESKAASASVYGSTAGSTAASSAQSVGESKATSAAVYGASVALVKAVSAATYGASVAEVKANSAADYGSSEAGGSFTSASQDGSKFTCDLKTYRNWKIATSGDFSIQISNVADAIGKGGAILIEASNTLGNMELASEMKTPLGQSISLITASGSVSILSYLVISATSVLVNYIGDFR